MNDLPASRSIVVARDMPHAPEKVWRALTEAPLVSEWLMQTDLQPVVGHRFNFRSEPVKGWNGVTDCVVLEAEPPKRLVYSWCGHGEQAGTGIKSVVSWTLTPTAGGTHLHMEHAGFRPDDEGFYQGASYGWPQMIEALERVAGGVAG